jgi:hypothetical protein
MRIRIAVPEAHVAPDVIDAALEAVTRLDEHMIRSGQAPSSRELVRAGARWRPEPPGDEHFDHALTVAARGWGDCDDWAPLHAATLRASGEDPGAVARVVPSGPSTYHAIVQRSDGSIEDPSVAAGMEPHGDRTVVGETMRVWACDPHDGRIYEGSLVPSVAPLTGHCGPAIAVRGCHVVGLGDLYEARCDLPIVGSRLVHVRAHTRHWPRHRRRRRVHGATSVVGAAPYALSSTALAASPAEALDDAIVGAILCGDAAEMSTSLDRYKLLAIQAALAGARPDEIRAALIAQMHADAQQAHQAHQAHEPAVVGDLFGDIASAADSVMHAVQPVIKAVQPIVQTAKEIVDKVPLGAILHGAEAIVSLVPGLGTAASDILATAETAYEAARAALHGNPLEAAIHAAYNYALASVPGAAALRFLLDPVVDFLINLTVKHEPVESAVIDALLKQVPDTPKIGPLSPRTVAASLAHVIADKLGLRNTGRARPGQRVVLPAHAAPHPALHPLIAPQLHLAHLAAPHLASPLAAMHPAYLAHLSAPGLAAMHAAIPHSPGAPPGASRWVCSPGPGGSWHCRWV